MSIPSLTFMSIAFLYFNLIEQGNLKRLTSRKKMNKDKKENIITFLTTGDYLKLSLWLVVERNVNLNYLNLSLF